MTTKKELQNQIKILAEALKETIERQQKVNDAIIKYLKFLGKYF